MNPADLAASGHVTLQCPACGAREDAQAGLLGDAPRIVCRKCGETWPAEPMRNKRSRVYRSARRRRPAPELIDAARRPLVTYSKGVDKAWAAKVEGDWWPEPPRRSRIPLIAAAMAAIGFIAAFVAGRERAVAAVPDLAGLYAAVGLPVNLDGLLIEEIAAERVPGDDGTRLAVRGVIRNVSAREQPVPALTASVYESGMTMAGWRGFNPPARVMAVGEAAPFHLKLEGVPPQAESVVIRFRRPAEVREAGEGGNSGP